MSTDLTSMADLSTFALVAQHRGFRQAARASVKPAMPRTNSRRRPKRSPSRPPVISSMPNASS